MKSMPARYCVQHVYSLGIDLELNLPIMMPTMTARRLPPMVPQNTDHILPLRIWMTAVLRMHGISARKTIMKVVQNSNFDILPRSIQQDYTNGEGAF